MAKLRVEMQQAQKLQENYLKKLNDELKKLPQGCLYYSIRGAHRYYYHSTSWDGERQKEYLSVKVPAQISSRLAATYENIKDAAGPQQDPKNLQSQQYLDRQNAPYPRADMYEENLKHEAIGGLMVRSKSEALIAFALDLAHIPFHYEEILELESKKIAPDFTILHPVTEERVYWEHFGMMDDVAYATETYKKLIAYGQNGILPGKNLIFTMETNAEPLGIREIQGMITHYLLN